VMEDTLMRDAAAVTGAFASLEALGVGVTLDRFGSGHASIAALRRFPLRELKLDSALLDGTERDHDPLLSALFGVAAALALPVAAVGVETDVQRQRLRALGCIQDPGSHFAKPLQSEASCVMLYGDGGCISW